MPEIGFPYFHGAKGWLFLRNLHFVLKTEAFQYCDKVKFILKTPASMD